MLAALAGGVGAARLLRGLVAVTEPSGIAAIVNTGDDIVLHGLHVSPDLDTVTYTLAGAVSHAEGWGLEGESWRVLGALDRYARIAPRGSSAGQTWFRLGDCDLATHLYRTQRLREGATLTDVTAEIARAWGLTLQLLPMSDDRVETRVTVAGAEIGFQDYFVARRHAVAVEAVRFAGAEQAAPGPAVLEALRVADRIVICPSNPIVSVGPVLAVPGISRALQDRREDVVAVSPIVAGAALKGPTARLLVELGHECSVVGVARLYAPFAATLVMDQADSSLAAAVAAEGVRPVMTPTVMTGHAEAAALAKVVLS